MSVGTGEARSGMRSDEERMEPGDAPGPIDDVLRGELASCRGCLRVGDGTEVGLSGRDFLDPGVFDEAIRAFSSSHPDADDRALVSLWSLYYFATLVTPAVAASEILEVRLPLALEDIRVVVDPGSGQVRAFVLPPFRRVQRRGSALDRLDPLVRGHLDPLIRTLTARYGLSPRLLWGNVGHYAEWALARLPAGEDGELPGATEHELLSRREWRDGEPNPLRGTIRYLGGCGGCVRRRRVCCLRYMIPSVDSCGSLCPLRGAGVADSGGGDGA